MIGKEITLVKMVTSLKMKSEWVCIWDTIIIISQTMSLFVKFLK